MMNFLNLTLAQNKRYFKISLSASDPYLTRLKPFARHVKARVNLICLIRTSSSISQPFSSGSGSGSGDDVTIPALPILNVLNFGATMATRKVADHTLYHLSPKGFWKKFRGCFPEAPHLC